MDKIEESINFIKNAKPLYLPNGPIGYIVTSRLEKYRNETEEWLKNNGINYKKLFMLNATAEERSRLSLYAKFKSKIYKKLNSHIFIESDDKQAQEISEQTKKLVICATTDKAYLYE